MEKSLIATGLIIAIFSILVPCFIWINKRFNNYEEFEELEENALAKLAIKNQLFKELHHWINDNQLDAKQIQEKLRVTPKKSADIIYQRIDQFTVDSLIAFLLRTGKKLTVSIHDH